MQFNASTGVYEGLQQQPQDDDSAVEDAFQYAAIELRCGVCAAICINWFKYVYISCILYIYTYKFLYIWIKTSVEVLERFKAVALGLCHGLIQLKKITYTPRGRIVEGLRSKNKK